MKKLPLLLMAFVNCAIAADVQPETSTIPPSILQGACGSSVSDVRRSVDSNISNVSLERALSLVSEDPRYGVAAARMLLEKGVASEKEQRAIYASLKAGSDTGDAESSRLLSDLLERGVLYVDPDTAFYFLRKSALQGDISSCLKTAEIYQAKKKHADALDYLSGPGYLGAPENQLSELNFLRYVSFKDVNPDKKEANESFQLAVLGNNQAAILEAIKVIRNADSFNGNRDEIIRVISKAAMEGDAPGVLSNAFFDQIYRASENAKMAAAAYIVGIHSKSLRKDRLENLNAIASSMPVEVIAWANNLGVELRSEIVAQIILEDLKQ